jgi:polyhydroxybutyrate depolymerase
VDDVAYLASVIDDVKQRRNIDPGRVFVVGHSNGGFMALRLACDLSNRVAGVVSIAGAGSDAPQKCRPSAPVAVLQIHGDQDWRVPYGGGRVLRRKSGGTHPSAPETVARWARRNGCVEKPVGADDLDLEPDLPGAETAVTRHTGCKGGAAELWTVNGGDHFVAQHPAALDAMYDFLMAHPRTAAAD